MRLEGPTWLAPSRFGCGWPDWWWLWLLMMLLLLLLPLLAWKAAGGRWSIGGLLTGGSCQGAGSSWAGRCSSVRRGGSGVGAHRLRRISGPA